MDRCNDPYRKEQLMSAPFRLLVLLATIWSFGASAEPGLSKCDTITYEALSQHFKLPALGSKVVSGACKAWPDDPSLTLAAVAYDSGTADEKSLLVAMVQKEPQRVIA